MDTSIRHHEQDNTQYCDNKDLEQVCVHMARVTSMYACTWIGHVCMHIVRTCVYMR